MAPEEVNDRAPGQPYESDDDEGAAARSDSASQPAISDRSSTGPSRQAGAFAGGGWYTALPTGWRHDPSHRAVDWCARGGSARFCRLKISGAWTWSSRV